MVRDIEYYNRDAILSVGYRVNSKRGTQFRIWVKRVLRKHGYLPDRREEATETVLEQTEVLSHLWASG